MICCTTHPSVAAGWHCPLCAKELCVECAALSTHAVVVCAVCGTLAPIHLAPRGEVFPFHEVWPSALREVRSPAGVFQVLVMGTAAHGFLTWGKSLWVIGLLISVAWVLNLARRAALGMGAFGWIEWGDVRLVAGGPLLRFSCAVGLIGVGAMVWTRLGLVARSIDSPWTWLLLLGALIAVPPSLAVSSIEGAGRTILWPWRLPHWLRVLGADVRPLQVAVLVAAVFALIGLMLPPANRELEDMEMLPHLVESWVPRLLMFAALGALGPLAGLLVFTRAGQLGHRRPEDDLVPSERRPPTGHYVPPVRDLEAEAAQRARRFAPIEIDESGSQSAIDRGARDEAIAAYRAGALRAEQLELVRAVTLAQWLAGSGDFLGAANLLRVVTGRVGGEDEARAKAMVVLARLCFERLDTPLVALRLYEEVVQRFPASSAARFAAKQLAALR